MTKYLTDLADVLRAAGLAVQELPGWEAKGYPKWGGYAHAGAPNHVMVHHTASGPKSDGVSDLNYITTNPLAPICNLYLDRSGTFHVVAAGRVATNGAGSSLPWKGGVPNDMMNHYAISVEAANGGTGEQWPAPQTDAYVAGVAALCRAYSIPVDHVRAHHEWAPGRKIDPAGNSPYANGRAMWDMGAFRRDVAAALEPAPTPVPAERLDPVVDYPKPTLKWGSYGPEVSELQNLTRWLGLDPGPVDGRFGRMTTGAVKRFQVMLHTYSDGIYGPKTAEATRQFLVALHRLAG
jgi:hypothetical protein